MYKLHHTASLEDAIDFIYTNIRYVRSDKCIYVKNVGVFEPSLPELAKNNKEYTYWSKITRKEFINYMNEVCIIVNHRSMSLYMIFRLNDKTMIETEDIVYEPLSVNNIALNNVNDVIVNNITLNNVNNVNINSPLNITTTLNTITALNIAPQFIAQIRRPRIIALQNKIVIKVLAHLRYVFAGGIRADYNYLLKWISYICQNPTKRIGKGIVLYDPFGYSGKSLISQILYDGIFGILCYKCDNFEDYMHQAMKNFYSLGIISLYANNISKLTPNLTDLSKDNLIIINTRNTMPPNLPDHFKVYTINQTYPAMDKKDYFDDMINITQDDCDDLYTVFMTEDLSNFIM